MQAMPGITTLTSASSSAVGSASSPSRQTPEPWEDQDRRSSWSTPTPAKTSSPALPPATPPTLKKPPAFSPRSKTSHPPETAFPSSSTPPASAPSKRSEPFSTPILVFLGGDHSPNEAKPLLIAGGVLRPMTPEELQSIFNAPAGYLGPIGIEAAPHPKKPGTLVILDKALEGRTNLIAGANKEEYHLRNVTPTRDFKPTAIADARNTLEGDGGPTD